MLHWCKRQMSWDSTGWIQSAQYKIDKQLSVWNTYFIKQILWERKKTTAWKFHHVDAPKRLSWLFPCIRTVNSRVGCTYSNPAHAAMPKRGCALERALWPQWQSLLTTLRSRLPLSQIEACSCSLSLSLPRSVSVCLAYSKASPEVPQGRRFCPACSEFHPSATEICIAFRMDQRL